MEAYIAGIDPGTNMAIVIIDENGKIVDKISGKNLTNSEIIEYISKLHKVVLLATDKKDIPERIKEISSKLGIGINKLKRDITLEEKSKFYKDNNLKNLFSSDHELDAYIAAYFALAHNKKIFDKAKNISNNEEEYIKILRLAFRSRGIEPISAKRILENNIKETNKSKRTKRIKKLNSSVDNYYLKIFVLKKEKNILKLKNKLKEINEKYVDLLLKFNEMSIYLLDRIKNNDNIIPKLSFLEINNKKSRKIFVDIINENTILKHLKEDTILYIPKDIYEKINKNILKEFYLVYKYKDLKNFVIPESFSFEKNNKEEQKEDYIIEKIKKMIKDSIG